MNKMYYKEKKIIIFFTDSNSLWLLKLLKKGFRHCFMAININNNWIIYEPMLHKTEFSIIKNKTEKQITNCFTILGCKALSINHSFINNKCNNLILTPINCVSSVIKAIGIKTKFIFTPWQLYKYINKLNKTGINNAK